MRHHPEQVLDLVAELPSDAEHLSPIRRTEQDPVAAQLATKNRHLGLEKPHLGVPAGGVGVNDEVSEDVEPA